MLTTPASCSMPFFKGNATYTELSADGFRLFLSDPGGEIEQTRYRVFPGIHLIYNNIHRAQSVYGMEVAQNHVIEIDHCREGRMECGIGPNRFYLAPGDVVLHRMGDAARDECFPTSHYHGITIQIDLEQTPQCLTCLLEDVDVCPKAIAEKFRLEENGFFALRQLPSIEHIFTELYQVPDTVRKGYMKIKVLEMFLFLRSLEPERDRLEQRKFSGAQAALAQNVCSYAMAHPDKHITTAELAEHFGVSASQIKTSFDGVYGTSVQAYLRGQRMQAAAKLLRQTDLTVLDIAGRYGYDNASKFAGAFRAVLGVTPTQYRNGLFHVDEA